MSTSEPIIRPAEFKDADAIATIHWAARKEAMPWLPRVHSALDLRNYVARTLLREQTVFVAERHGKVIGYAAWKDDWLNHLYVSPKSWRVGIGTALLAHAKKRMPNGFHFWVFQRNVNARSFYEKYGCRMIRETDGSGNEEKEPDVEYEWKADLKSEI